MKRDLPGKMMFKWYVGENMAVWTNMAWLKLRNNMWDSNIGDRRSDTKRKALSKILQCLF